MFTLVDASQTYVSGMTCTEAKQNLTLHDNLH